MSFGTLSIKDNAIPLFSPPYSNNPNKFSKITIISIAYRVTLASVQHLVPDVLELESEPLMTTWFIDYGMSSVGSYKEFLQFVEVTYKGEKFNYALFLALDNEAAIFAGREVKFWQVIHFVSILDLKRTVTVQTVADSICVKAE
ncbi:putative acetoacetate decarboxylase protein [Neofusicoccum parvum UCRNP2]|uniref:Putative acetoacetate decarboxylase protein n=1 Tax=Botryosphaeria parva (strain UCR-NP2) TaxID=1287680 RepID=R1GFP6_BOTPV|nr:putative acetoacetate decarboxylase protein [Neofusicoccum parvum UCRNP2]